MDPEYDRRTRMFEQAREALETEFRAHRMKLVDEHNKFMAEREETIAKEDERIRKAHEEKMIELRKQLQKLAE